MQEIHRASYTPIYAQVELVDREAAEPYSAEHWVEADAPDGFLGPRGLVVTTMNDIDVEVVVFQGPGQPEGRLCLCGSIQVGQSGLGLGTISQQDAIPWPAGWTAVSVFVNAWPGTEVTQVNIVLEALGQEPPLALASQPDEQMKPLAFPWQELTNEPAVERLVTVVRVGGPLPGYLGLRALVALGTSIRQRMLALLSDPAPHVRLIAVRMLGQCGSEALAPVLNARSAQEERQAREALDQLAAEILGPLSQALRDSEALIRREVAYQLCSFGRSLQQEAVPRLIQALNDPDRDVRSSAALSLGMSGDARALEPLLHQLTKQDELPIVRRTAVEGLDLLADRRAIPSLLQIIKQPNEDPEVRLFAVRALTHLGDAQVVEAFQRLLLDQMAPIRLRKAAADGLGALGENTSLAVLADALNQLETTQPEGHALQERIRWAMTEITERLGE